MKWLSNTFIGRKVIAFSLPLILLSLLLITAACNKPEKKDTLTFLKVSGQDMVDENGNKVLLKSIGLGNWLLPEGYMWKFGKEGDRPRKIEKVLSDLIGDEKAQLFWEDFRANYITELDIIRIKELGFNAVRPALNARLFLTEDEEPVFVEEGFQHLDNLIKWCKKHQLYVIIDMHGAPGGQTGANIDDSANDLPELFINSKHQDALLKLWIEIAKKYKNEPIVAAYDLLNEPLPENTGAAEKYGHLVEPLYKRLTSEIRKFDTKHMITLEGINWSNDWDIFGPPFDSNTFYQFHYYCWDNPDNLKDINYFIQKREDLNTPIWVGETGEKANAIYWGTTQYFEANNIGWSFWPWKKMDTQNTPYSIKKPAHWDLIAAYTKGGEKPSAEIAEQAFSELLENIKLSNCIYFEDVTNAIFRRLPVRIEAENYMHGGYNETWFVRDTLQKSSYYRSNEFVPIELIAVDSLSHPWKWYTEQCIVLQPDEWTVYNVMNIKDTITYAVYLNACAEKLPGKISVTINGIKQIVEINEFWKEYPLGTVTLNSGNISIEIKAIDGVAKIDWLAIKS